jgi:hypothetical protein
MKHLKRFYLELLRLYQEYRLSQHFKRTLEIDEYEIYG